MRVSIIASSLILLTVASHALGATDEEFIKAGEQFAQLLVDGEYEKAVQSFDETMTKAMPVVTLKSTWEQMQAAHGPFRSLGEPAIGSHAQYKLVFVPCRWERAAFRLKECVPASRSRRSLRNWPKSSA